MCGTSEFTSHKIHDPCTNWLMLKSSLAVSELLRRTRSLGWNSKSKQYKELTVPALTDLLEVVSYPRT